MRTITTENGSVHYMNSGDRIEHMSALEFADGKWTLYQHERMRVVAEERTVALAIT